MAIQVDMDAVKNIFFYGFIIVILYILITGELTRNNVIFILILIIGTVILDLIYRAFKEQSKKDDDPSSGFPSDKYMDKVGGLCPDYWEAVGYEKNGNPICKNMFNIPVVPKTMINGKQYKKCFNKDTNDTKTFRRIKWPIEDDALHGSDHCKWVKNCGPADGARASWLGVDDKC